MPRGLTPSAPVRAVGARLPRVDGWPKVAGTDRFGADEAPADALWMRVVRSPHARARFTLGDLDAVKARNPGLAAILTAKDVPGENAFGIFPAMKDQPVLAPGLVRFRGEAVLALVGTRAAVEGISDAELPIAWTLEAPLSGIEAALAPGAPALHAGVPDNVLARGNLKCGDVRSGARARGRHRRGQLRDGVRRARLHRAGGRLRRADRRGARPHRGHGLHAGALHGPRGDGARAGRRAVARAHPPDRLRRRLRRQARRVGAAAAGGGGLGDAAPRAHRLHAHGIDGLHHQAPSRAHLGQVVGRRAGPPHGLRDAGRFQHRRLCLVGADGGQPRAGARHGTLRGAQRLACARARSTPTTRRPAPSAASACRRRRSRTRR